MTTSRSATPAAGAPLLFERYAVYDEFASGGMATVHFARLLGAQGFRRTVAAKRLLAHRACDPELSLMLVDEARLAGRIRHPNVVSTLDVVQTEREVLLVMDYVHGASLAELSRSARAQGERVPLAFALAIVCDALHGLHAAHEARDEAGSALGLVHRDVSPHNILVGVDGVTRIADFGVAKAMGRLQSTHEGAVKGKRAYMAPEQLTTGQASRASDVFAAAVVLWELIAGERLFAGNSDAETIYKIIGAELVPPTSADGALSPALEAIVMRGLARDPTLRFSSAHEMAVALEATAPSVRASELGAWVERMAGAKLQERAERLLAIEQLESARPHEAPRPQRRLAWTFMLAALVLGLLSARAVWSAPPVETSTRVLSAPRSTEPQLPPRQTLQADQARTQPRPSSTSGSAAATAEPSSGQLAPRRRADTPHSRATTINRCDPPTTRDASGHVLFKLECL